MTLNNMLRLPAEWETQAATLLAWPAPHTDWADRLNDIQQEYTALIRAICRRQAVFLLVPPGSDEACRQVGDLPGVHRIEAPYDDTWCRDYGPIMLVGEPADESVALDFHFNGWGGKYPAARDNAVNSWLARQPPFRGLRFCQSPFELEGGAIESDGHGTLLINWHCLQARHPQCSRDEIESELQRLLGLRRVIGIDMAPLTGDDTDGHIDTIARFIASDSIAYQRQADSERQARLLAQLQALRQLDGQPYQLIELPLPDGVDPKLPANYANFLFINGACLVPAYGVPADQAAREQLARTLQGRGLEAESVASAVMIQQYGGPHCASMHLPAVLP